MRLIVLFLMLICPNTSAYAGEYTLKARQINPHSSFYSQHCVEDKKDCHLYMGLRADSMQDGDSDLHITVLREGQTYFFQFQSNLTYFLTSDDGEDILALTLDNEKHGTAVVKLYQPDAASDKDPHGLYQYGVVRPKPTFLGELEVSVQKSPD